MGSWAACKEIYIQPVAPMTYGDSIFLYLLVVPDALLLVVLVALLRRQLYRNFPVFLTYVIEDWCKLR